MRNINHLNALTNPLALGETVFIAGETWTVAQTVSGAWFLKTFNDVECLASTGMVDFIANIIAFHNRNK